MHLVVLDVEISLLDTYTDVEMKATQHKTTPAASPPPARLPQHDVDSERNRICCITKACHIGVFGQLSSRE